MTALQMASVLPYPVLSADGPFPERLQGREPAPAPLSLARAEQTVDEICESTGEKKPRMYRKCARRDFLRLSKSKKCSTKAIRSAIKKQLQYIRRDIGYIVQFVQNGIFLSSTYIDSLTDADSVLLSAHTSAYRDCQSVLHQRIQCPHLVMDVSLYSDCLKRPLFADATL